MISVMHLFDRTLDAEDRRTRETIARRMPADVGCTAIRIGPGGEARDAFAAGIRVRFARPDVVHAWGPAALAAAAVVGRETAIVYSPIPPSCAALRSLNWIARWRTVHVVVRSEAELRSIKPLAGAIAIRPAVDPQTLDRATVRRSFGLRDDDIALLPVGESTRAAAHASAVWAAGILNVLDRRFKVLLWGHGPLAPAAVKLAKKLRQRDMVIVADAGGRATVEWESLVAAADVGLLTAEGPVATWPVAAVMADGLPLVSTIDVGTSDFVSARTAKLAEDSSPRTLARCVLDVRDGPAAAAARVTAARSVAAELFSIDRLIADYAGVYRRAVTGKPATMREPYWRKVIRPAGSTAAASGVI